MTTVIRNADYVVAFDGQKHRLIQGGDVAYDGNTITYVGKKYTGNFAKEISGSGRMVMPGLINTHGHATSEALKKGVLEDRGARRLGMSGLYDSVATVGPVSPEDKHIALNVGLTEMLKSGCTTVLEEGSHDVDTVEVVAATGIRAYTTRAYNAGMWYTTTGTRVDYDLDEARGEENFAKTLDFIDKVNGTHNDRIRSLLSPHAPDTCPPSLIQKTREYADKLNLPVHVHASQSVVEFDHIMRTYGQTPVEYLHANGLSGPDVMYGHCIFTNDHPWIQFVDARDFELIVETNTTVDYAPWVFGRRGIIMYNFAKYIDAGVNVSLGTDSFPQDMMEAMRFAAIFTKNAERDPWRGTSAQVFNAATLGGAKALGRDDLGRISVGAKADLVLVDLNTLHMRPIHDPIKSLVFSATSKAVDTVIVDGEIVVEGREIKTVNEAELIPQLQAASERAVEAAFPGKDYLGRQFHEANPLAFDVWDGPDA